MAKLTTAERNKAKRLEEKYNQTLEEHNAKRSEQKNACAICRRPFTQYQPFQDHDHKCCPRHRKEKLNRYCGKCNRGLICYLCNRRYVPRIEQMLKDGVDPKTVVDYLVYWTNEIKLKGGYAGKKETTRVRKEQKSVRQRHGVSPKNGAATTGSNRSHQSRTVWGKWRVTKPGKAQRRGLPV